MKTIMESRCTAKLTCLQMEKLKEKEGINSNKKIVNQLQTTLAQIEPVLLDSFGFEGLAVFVQKFGGNILLTRSGAEILDNVLLESADIDNSIQTFLSRYCKTINNMIGDGTKRFVFYVYSLIKLLLSGTIPISRRLKQLQKLQCVLKMSESSFCDRKDSLVLNKNKLECTIKTFMATRFTLAVADKFSELTYDWILSYDNDEDCINSNKINMLLKNLNVLCIRNCEPSSLSESKIEKGFLIKGRINNLYKYVTFESHCVLKVFIFNKEDEDSNNIEKFESDVIRLISETNSEDINDSNKILLVTNLTLSESLLFYLRVRNVISIDGVLNDDVIFLNDLVLEYKSKDFVSKFKYVNDNNIYISLPNISQLILCTPTNDLWVQLRESLKNLLTLINYSLNNTNIIYDVNGNFELFMYDRLFKKCKIEKHDKPPVFINNRKELLEWHARRKYVDDKNLYDNIKIETDINRYSIYGNLFAEDLIVFNDFISYMTEQIVSKHELTCDSFTNFLCDLFYYIVRIVRPKGSACDFIYLDLVSPKLGILYYAIDFVLYIFNIDSVIRCKRM